MFKRQIPSQKIFPNPSYYDAYEINDSLNNPANIILATIDLRCGDLRILAVKPRRKLFYCENHWNPEQAGFWIHANKIKRIVITSFVEVEV